MHIGVIADDFTGASDIANTLAKGWADGGGLRTTQFLGIPVTAAPADCEAGVVSLKSRSIPAAEAVAQSLAALEWLQAQGCRQIVFKYCSTFDSTPQGNIGPVGEALAQALGVRGVPACPAFPGAGRTVFQGHLFVGDRLLSESSVATHPLNPMTDPDIRRWLTRQSTEPVGLVPHQTVRQGAAPIRTALDRAGAGGERLVIVDAISDEDLVAIGEACADLKLITGGSGIALGLPRNLIAQGVVTGRRGAFTGVQGPEAILAGSCSRTTLAQIELHRSDHAVLEVDVDAVIRNEVTPSDVVEFIRANEGLQPLVFSSNTPANVAAYQARYGTGTVAHALEQLFAQAARILVDGGLRRLVVAGGETSGAVVSALGLQSLEIGPEIDPGVPVLIDRGTSLALALKSGNFGAPDFFAKALAALEARP
ncbi:3-oxo-tetronate kinase [Microvirga aerophila]|uniref:3-oxo-tetronate kinase n=1 Tax=Microvirga aerophila TaxID=670291 RepID=A0A512C1N4_9HYPH|nr:3-oxo-tetronate kinase [Microvirga aerophila]GEO18111.1 HPr kinase [Microvirga aerophila]